MPSIWIVSKFNAVFRKKMNKKTTTTPADYSTAMTTTARHQRSNQQQPYQIQVCIYIYINHLFIPTTEKNLNISIGFFFAKF